MATFQGPIDIWNRGLDHCGARVTLSATEGTRNSTKCAEIYDKLRQAELRRNLWVFATRTAALRPIDTTTMRLVPNAYDDTISYTVGDIIAFNDGVWICVQPNMNVPPTDSNGTVSPDWDCYYGPLTVDVWNNPVASLSNVPLGASYHAGEIVYLAPGNGTFSAFLSLVDGNNDSPLASDAWSSGTTYASGQVVLGSNGTLYQSAVNLNINNDPTITVPAAAWVSGTTYAVGAYAFYTDGMIYQSLVASNTGHIPPSSPTDWVATGMWNATWLTSLTPQPRSTSNNWHFLACSLQPISIVFPVSAGPLSNSLTKNLYLLPNNYLRRAPPETQLGNKISWLGAMAPMPEDFVFTGTYIISQSVSPIVLRFVADFQNVSGMDPMFCEGLAAKMGWELAETLTQKPDLRAFCVQVYKDVIREASTVNAIETGPVEEVEDDYIRVRY